MYYRLLVTKMEPNPAFDADAVKEYEERSQYHHFSKQPDMRQEIDTRQLDVVVSEEEYAAIKQAVIGTFK